MSRPYRFHTDPGHGWLEVPRADCEALGPALVPSFSSCSYQSRDGWTLFLEEDCDAPRFLRAWEAKHGRPYDVRADVEVCHRGDAPCRSYPRLVEGAR